MHTAASRPLTEALRSRLLFVEGKGGVGRSTVSLAIAHGLAAKKKKTLWVTFDDPLLPAGVVQKESATLSTLNCKAGIAFQEYIGLKLGVPSLTQIFLKNSVIQYMAEAAPGIRELVILGKVWFERENYDHVICDMPSTGYALAMFHSTRNFAKLFGGGPVHRDSEAMHATFSSPQETAQIIVSLPEEMPMVESLELDGQLRQLFPKNPCAFIINRCLPETLTQAAPSDLGNPENWKTPFASGRIDYLVKRKHLETEQSKTWKKSGIDFSLLPYLCPHSPDSRTRLAIELSVPMEKQGWFS